MLSRYLHVPFPERGITSRMRLRDLSFAVTGRAGDRCMGNRPVSSERAESSVLCDCPSLAAGTPFGLTAQEGHPGVSSRPMMVVAESDGLPRKPIAGLSLIKSTRSSSEWVEIR